MTAQWVRWPQPHRRAPNRWHVLTGEGLTCCGQSVNRQRRPILRAGDYTPVDEYAVCQRCAQALTAMAVGR